MNELDIHSKTKRTSKEQLDCYLAFVRSHPEIKLHKNDPTCPKRIEELWKEIAEQLNALKGPKRTAAKWKDSLNHWKNQIRSRARKSKADRLVTGGGPRLQEELTERENLALETLGSVVVDGMPDIPNIGAESEIVITNDPVTPSVESTDESLNSPRPSRRRKTNSDDLIKQMIKSLNERNEEEKQFRERSLNCMEQFCNSMNNVANAILALSQAVVNKDNNNT